MTLTPGCKTWLLRQVWRLTKAGAEKAGGVSLAVMLEIGKAYGKQVLKDRLGIDLP